MENKMFFLPQSAKRVLMHRQPVSMRWGHDKLAKICSDAGYDLNANDVFLFFNKSKDSIKIYFKDSEGDQSVMKKLERGGFLLPVAKGDQQFTKISPISLIA